MGIEYIPKCKQLRAKYRVENGILGGPHDAEICINKEAPIRVTIHQAGTRTITIVAEKDVSVQILYTVLVNVEELLMVFDGKFIPLDNLCFSDSEEYSVRDLSHHSLHSSIRRPSYFTSSDFCKYNFNKLIEFDNVLTEDLFSNWERLLEILDIAHKMFMYSICDSGLTADVKCVFLIELAESFVETVKEEKHLFPSLKPGNRSTSLMQCLDALITVFGKEIFEKESGPNYETFLQILVNSRVRIMHIKRNQTKEFLNGEQSLLYSAKLCLLYRCIILDLLGVEKCSYYDQLCKCVQIWDDQVGVIAGI